MAEKKDNRPVNEQARIEKDPRPVQVKPMDSGRSSRRQGRVDPEPRPVIKPTQKDN